jgi:hypothetical protein
MNRSKAVAVSCGPALAAMTQVNEYPAAHGLDIHKGNANTAYNLCVAHYLQPFNFLNEK